VKSQQNLLLKGGWLTRCVFLFLATPFFRFSVIIGVLLRRSILRHRFLYILSQHLSLPSSIPSTSLSSVVDRRLHQDVGDRQEHPSLIDTLLHLRPSRSLHHSRCSIRCVVHPPRPKEPSPCLPTTSRLSSKGQATSDASIRVVPFLDIGLCCTG